MKPSKYISMCDRNTDPNSLESQASILKIIYNGLNSVVVTTEDAIKRLILARKIEVAIDKLRNYAEQSQNRSVLNKLLGFSKKWEWLCLMRASMQQEEHEKRISDLSANLLDVTDQLFA